MKIIDIKNWKRRVPYENFIKYSNPVFSLSTRLDVTQLYNLCKRRNTSFFTDFLYIVMKSINETEEFRLRICRGKVVLYDKVKPSFIVLTDDGVIAPCRVDMKYDYRQFYAEARAQTELVKNGGNAYPFSADGDNDCCYISCMPWTDLTAINNPYNYSDADSTSIPRLAWSKCVDENGRKKMTMDIAAHHALIDGEPVCRAFNLIQKYLDNAEEILR